MSGRDFFAVDGRRWSSPLSVVAVVRHFHFFIQGRDLWKKSDFRCFSKTHNFSEIQDFLQNEWTRFFRLRRSSLVVAVVRRRRRSSFPLFHPREGPLKKIRFSLFFKNSQFFWNPRFFAKWVDEIFSPSTVVVGRRRRRSSPSSVISLFRPREGPLKKIRFSLFFKNSQFFWNPRFLAKWVDEIFSPSTVVVGRRRCPSSPSFVISTFSSKGGTFEKNQIFAVFQKLAIFLKSKIFSKMSGRDFFAINGRRRSSPSSVVAVVRHFHFFVQGRDLWKKSDFRCFSKTRNFSEIQDF